MAKDIPMIEVARYMKTSIYEGSCMLNSWIPRLLIKNGQVVEIDERKD